MLWARAGPFPYQLHTAAAALWYRMHRAKPPREGPVAPGPQVARDRLHLRIGKVLPVIKLLIVSSCIV